MKLTKNFNLREFKCNDGSSTPLDVVRNLEKLATNLQVLRDKVGEPITITSGYRSESHNKKIGGAKNSQHVLGTAADFKVKGMRPNEVYAIIENLIKKGEMMEGGLGLYSNWIHYDIRGTKARW